MREVPRKLKVLFMICKNEMCHLCILVFHLFLLTSYFSYRISEYSEIESEEMVKALQNAIMIDEDKMMMKDPRESNWRNIMSLFGKEHSDMTSDASPLSEVMNAVYTKHEMSRDGVLKALNVLLESFNDQKDYIDATINNNNNNNNPASQ